MPISDGHLYATMSHKPGGCSGLSIALTAPLPHWRPGSDETHKAAAYRAAI